MPIKIIKGSSTLKKRLSALKQQYGRRYYMSDEMRAGTRTAGKSRWTPRGHRPVLKMKLGYTFTYLYAAIAPATGKLIALLLPDMTKQCFGIFVDHFKKQTKALHGTHKVVLIADRAGSHQQDVCEQKGIAFEPLPAGCPELNPVERFFEELRKALSNRIFKTVGW